MKSSFLKMLVRMSKAKGGCSAILSSSSSSSSYDSSSSEEEIISSSSSSSSSSSIPGTISISASSTTVACTQNAAITAITLTGTASNGNVVTFSASGLPEGLSLSGSTISGTLTGTGSYNATITASATGCTNATLAIAFTVEAAPVVQTYYYTVSGSDTAGINGNYELYSGTHGTTSAVYTNGTAYLYYNNTYGTYWIIHTTNGESVGLYYKYRDGITGNYDTMMGSSPAPTVSEYSGVSSSSTETPDSITVSNEAGMYSYACGTYVKQSTTYHGVAQWKHTSGSYDCLIRFNGTQWEIYEDYMGETMSTASGTASSNPCDLEWTRSFVLSSGSSNLIFQLADSYTTSGFGGSTYSFNITWTKASVMCNGQPTYNGTGGKSLACTTDNYWIITTTQTSSYSGVKSFSTTTAKIYAYWSATMQGATPSPVCTDYTKFNAGSSYSSKVSITSSCQCVSDGTDGWVESSSSSSSSSSVISGAYLEVSGCSTSAANGKYYLYSGEATSYESVWKHESQEYYIWQNTSTFYISPGIHTSSTRLHDDPNRICELYYSTGYYASQYNPTSIFANGLTYLGVTTTYHAA